MNCQVEQSLSLVLQLQINIYVIYINTALWWRQITKILTAWLIKPVVARCPQKVPFSLSLAREQACVYTSTNKHIHISIYAHVHLNTCSVHLLTQALLNCRKSNQILWKDVAKLIALAQTGTRDAKTTIITQRRSWVEQQGNKQLK